MKHRIKIADGTARRIDENGYLHVKGCPISAHGIFDYSRAQCDPRASNPNEIIGVYRPEDEICDPDTIASFQNVPIIDDHTFISGADGDDLMAPEDKGVEGVLTNVRYEAPTLVGDLVVYSKRLQKKINNGKKELSLGYSCDFIPARGSANGRPYEYEQRGMRGNHVALVHSARVPGSRVLDSNDGMPNMEVNMSEKDKTPTFDASSIQTLQAILPALQAFLQEESQEPEHQGEMGAQPAPEAPTKDMCDKNTMNPGALSGMGGEGGGDTDPEAEGGVVPEQSGEPEAEVAADPNAEVGGEEPMTAAPAADPHAEVAAPAPAQMAAPAVGAPAVAGQEAPMSPEELMEITQLLKGILPKLEGIISTNAPQQPQQPQSMDGKDMPNPGVDPLEKDVKGTENENDAVLEKKLSKAADEAVKRAVSDASEKNALVERVSRVVGVFDHAEMDLNAVAKYGVEKIGIKCQDGLEKVALDGYFAGIAAASQHSPTRSLAGDAGEGGEVSAYLASLKK